ncbi:MAG: SMP-30/gluconolactonase/LRE family protein [Chthoniobacterales bacterium]
MRLIQTAIGLLLLCSGFGFPSTGFAENPDAAAAARANLERFQGMRKERPGDGILVFYEAMIRISLGQREAAFDLLRSLKGRHLGLIPVRDTGFDDIWDDPGFQKIRKELADEEPRTSDAAVAFRLTDPKLVPEGIAFDPGSGAFFLGSIAQRKIVTRDRTGQVRDFSRPEDKLDCILGLAVDRRHEHLYAVSTNGFESGAKLERRNAVVEYALKDGRATGRFMAPDALQLNDVTLAADGTIYATDSASGTLFRRQPGESSLNQFGERGALRGANGIAVAADGTLYVTLSTGIARVDTKTAEPVRMPQPDNVVTGGIDGLYWSDGDLFGIQNLTNPARVIRVVLADQGKRISGLTVLQSCHHPDFDEPTTGAMANGVLNVIANSYVGHYQPDGSIKDADTLKPTAVLAVPLKPQK